MKVLLPHDVARAIVNEACSQFQIEPTYIYGLCRATRAAAVRQICMHRLRWAFPHWSLPQIGRFMRRDHTTVLHALKKDMDLLHRRAAVPFDPDQNARALAYISRSYEQTKDVQKPLTVQKHILRAAVDERRKQASYERRLRMLQRKMASASR